MSAMCATRDILAIGFSNGVLILFNTVKNQMCYINKVSKPLTFSLLTAKVILGIYDTWESNRVLEADNIHD